MKATHLTLMFAAVVSLVVAPPVLVAQPPGDGGEAYEEEFSERAGVDEGGEFQPGAIDPGDYESDVVFPDEPFDYAEREYGEWDEYGTDYYDFTPYLDDDNGYDDFYTDDWFSDESAFDAWYDGE